jgi:DNA helicase IV
MEPVIEEQSFLDRAYSRLDEVRAQLAERVDVVLRAPDTGTPQDRLERQAHLDLLAQQAAAAASAEQRLCFGRIDRTDDTDGQTVHLGRIGLRDAAGEPLLLDWRAPQAAGFYQATTAEPMGIRRRRRIFTRERTVTHVEDEDLADPTAGVGERAAAASVSAPRDGRMADIVATIAADQDRIVRSPLNRVTVVQGGPGTGKTVVALHRAAWLLYTHRDRLARDGVLVVGPSNAFCRYIEQVLPSLGETDVVLLTPGELFPGVSTSDVDRPEVAAVKGGLVMARVVAQAVQQRVRLPEGDLVVRLADGSTARVSAGRLAQIRAGVPRRATYHAGREPFLRRVLDDLARDRAQRRGEDPTDPDVRAAHLEDLVEDPNVRRTLNLLWLPTTPERVIDRLLSDPQVLAAAAEGLLNPRQQELLLRPAGAGWTVDDVPLLDEAAVWLGEFVRPVPRTAPAEDDYAELTVVDPFARQGPSGALADRAAADRNWVYGHVVVDEAQELSRMAWRALARRCTRRSMTVVGDLQQTAHPAGARNWREVLDWAGDNLDLHTLTVTYRITRQTADTATELLVRAGGTAPELRPIRDGEPTEHLQCSLDELAEVALSRADDAGGRTGVIVADAAMARIRSVLGERPEFGFGADALDAPVAVLTARDSKGLEFDHVLVVDPEALLLQSRHGSDAYVACTRATRTLHLVTLTA